MATVSLVVTAVSTAIIAAMLLAAALVFWYASNQLSQAGTELEELFAPPTEEPLDDGGLEDFGEVPSPQPPDIDPFEGQGPTEEGLQAELDQLEAEFGPGPTPSAIRRTAEITSQVSDDDLRRYGLGVCFGVIAGSEQLAAESGLTQEEAERMIMTAEGWCSA